MTDAFLFLLHGALTTTSYPKIETGWETFHSVEVPPESENWRTISEKIGDYLSEFDMVKSPGAVSVPWEEEVGTAKDVISANARSRADRLHAAGWKPKQPSMMDCLRADVRQTLDVKHGGVEDKGVGGGWRCIVA